MALRPGTRLGAYEILAPIGAGGMGEVYRAKDTKLGREVAIKVLPQELSHDADRLARFEREAKLLASLNHPNIATLHGLEEHDGKRFLVMELVEGETLAKRIGRGPIPVSESIALFIQIAEGLAAAHEKSIVHRDLKPANIKIGVDGRARILDFGIAKALAGDDEAAVDSSRSPTLTKGTALGAILGTAAYMSPEQARGNPVDRRTDVWAFGVCLYEALTGRRPFGGVTVTDILAAILRAEVVWKDIPKKTPALVRRLMQRCLEKDRERRLRDMEDAAADLRDATQFEADVAPGSSRLEARRPIWPWMVAGVAAALAVGSWFGGKRRVADTSRPLRFDVQLPETTSYRIHGASLAISPDGSRVVFPVGRGPAAQLYLHDFTSGESEPIRGTEGGIVPFFSPDGEWIGFFAEGQLKKVPASGGTPVHIADARQWYGGSWGELGTIVYVPSFYTPLWRVAADGNTPPAPLGSLGPGELGHVWPQILPGERAVLFTVYSREMSVEAVSLQTGERRKIVENAAFGRYVPTGQLLFVRGNALMAVPFDAKELEVLGEAVAVIDDVAFTSTEASSQFAVSDSGTLVYANAKDMDPDLELVRVDRNGVAEALGEARAQEEPHVSADGRGVVLVVRNQEQQWDIWTFDIERRSLARLTDDVAAQVSPMWTPHGTGVVFATEPQDRSRGFDIARAAADRVGAWKVVRASDDDMIPSSITRDGRILAYTTGMSKERSADIWTVRLDGAGDPEALATTDANEGNAAFSPDERFVAYQSDESGRFEIYVEPYPGPGERYLISTNGGVEPVWSPLGDELFYRPLDENGLMSVTVTNRPRTSFGLPRLVFTGHYLRHRWSTPTSRNYDVMPDGDHFLMLRRATGDDVRMHVVVNWLEELKRIVPANR